MSLPAGVQVQVASRLSTKEPVDDTRFTMLSVSPVAPANSSAAEMVLDTSSSEDPRLTIDFFSIKTDD